MPNCKQCNTGFEVADSDRKFYERLQVPEPTLCPMCRYQRRLAWRNERTLYRRKCDKTGKSIISIYPEDAPFPVYQPEVWHGDDWDPLEFEKDYDFNRPFFEQFYELQQKVPRIANILVRTENCDYCNIIGDCKNCYLIFGSINCEDCLYGSPFNSKNCIDVLTTRNSEWCYECTDCHNLYECFFCQDCVNSNHLEYCFDLEGCNNCFLCAGLKRKEYHILNQPYSKEEYENKVGEMRKKGSVVLMEELESMKQKTPVKFMVGVGNEDVTGDQTHNSKNSHDLFFSEGCEEVNHSTQILVAHHCIDCDYGETGGYNIETSGFFKSTNLQFCHWIWEASDLYYSSTCGANSKNCFGCISLKHKEYCILNKQYSKEEYEDLLPKIIEHMKNTGEWGEFFPAKYSPFSYNETLAQEYFPLSKEEVESKGWSWRKQEEIILSKAKTIPADKLPGNIQEIPDDILNWAIECEVTKREFKITPKELQFYRKFDLPIPHFHPDERHRRRLAMRSLRKLFDRKCDKCSADIKTTYSPDRPEVVYCEQCYLKEVY